MYLPLSLFMWNFELNKIHALSGSLLTSTATSSIKVVDEVYANICGNMSYSDVKTPMERNGMCNADYRPLQYIISILNRCRAATKLKASRMGLLSSICRDLIILYVWIIYFGPSENAACYEFHYSILCCSGCSIYV